MCARDYVHITVARMVRHSAKDVGVAVLKLDASAFALVDELVLARIAGLRRHFS